MRLFVPGSDRWDLMRKIIAVIALAFIAALLVPTQADASSARNSSPGCVSKREWSKIRRNMTVAQVSRVFGTSGRQIYSQDHGDYTGAYVEDIDDDNTYYYPAGTAGDPYHFDDYGNVVDGYATHEVYDETTGEYVEEIDYDNTYYYDGSDGGPYHFDDNGDPVAGYATYEYYDDTAGPYVSRIDVIRSYKKCRSFNHGHGRLGINFDNYTGPDRRLHAFSRRTNVYDYFFRQSGRLVK